MAKRTTNADKLDTIVEKVSNIGTKLEVHIANFEAHISHEEEQKEELKRNTSILQTNTSSLQEHMQRTDALESYVKKIDERFTPVELESLRKKAVADWWKTRVIFMAKLGGAIGAVGAMGGILKMWLNS